MKNFKFIVETPIPKAQQPKGHLRRSGIGKLNNPAVGGTKVEGLMLRSLLRKLFPKLAFGFILVIIFNIIVIIHTVFIFAYAADIKKPVDAAKPSSAVPATDQPQIQPQAQAQNVPENNYKYSPQG